MPILDHPTPAGDFRDRVQIQQPTRTENPSTGEVTLTWATVATVWASIKVKTAQEYTENRQVIQRTQREIRIRYTPLMNAACRLMLGTKIINPTSVQDVDEAHVELLITTSDIGG